MTTMRVLGAVMLSGILLAGAACNKSGGTAASIDGKWVGSDLSNPGAQCELTVDHGTLTFRGTNADDSFSGTIATFYADQQPGSIDVKITEPQPLAGKVALFIFEHRGSELKLAWDPIGANSRPMDFTPAPGVRIISFKRP